MASKDILAAFTSALSLPQGSDEQLHALDTCHQLMQSDMRLVPPIWPTLLSVSAHHSAPVLREWLLTTCAAALASPALPQDTKNTLVFQSFDLVISFIPYPPSQNKYNLAISLMSSLYPVAFKQACTQHFNFDVRNWDKLTTAKMQLRSSWGVADTTSRILRVKFLLTVIKTQSRGSSDPRLRDRESNLNLCPANHPFLKIPTLEEEANSMLEECLTILYTNPEPNILSAILNAFVYLFKTRQALQHLVLQALTSWTPSSVPAPPPGSPSHILTKYHLEVRSLDKTLRLCLIHISKSGLVNIGSIDEINKTIAAIDARTRAREEEERDRKDKEIKRKRDQIERFANTGYIMPIPSGDEQAGKRRKLDNPPQDASNPLANFDVKTLPLNIVVELIVANLGLISQENLDAACNKERQRLGIPILAGPPRLSNSPLPAPPGPQNPLDTAADDEEAVGLAPQAGDTLDENQALEQSETSALASRQALLDDTNAQVNSAERDAKALKEYIIHSSLRRILDSGEKSLQNPLGNLGGGDKGDLWIELVVKFITRGFAGGIQQEEAAAEDEEESSKEETEKQRNKLRELIYEFIAKDVASRVELAKYWLSEEWNCAVGPQTNGHFEQSTEEITPKEEPTPPQIPTPPRPYIHYLALLLDAVSAQLQETHLAAQPRAKNRYSAPVALITPEQVKDREKALTSFVVDLPHLDEELLEKLKTMCKDQAQMKVGFTALRDIAQKRPEFQTRVLDALLAICVHPDKVPRNAAIVTTKRWVPEPPNLSEIIVNYAKSLLQRLIPSPEVESEQPKEEPQADSEMNGEAEEVEEGEEESLRNAIVQDGILLAKTKHPMTQIDVTQHIELLLALCVKEDYLLDEICNTYASLPELTQQTIQTLITPLVRHLSASNPRILGLVRNCPTGAESLILRILTILTEKGKLPPVLIELIRSLVSEKDLSARFMIPVIAEFDKAEIIKGVPRIVALLSGKPEDKALIRSVFDSIVTTPPSTFGTVSTNLARVRQTELLTPVELMSLLHNQEKEIGLKATIEAIGICFQMTDAFRPEVLAAFMQQIVDEPVLPTLFLRTVIQAVTLYKSLQPFVSTTLLSRLITKKVWTSPQLWEGFIRCAKATAPHSFGALLQLPKDQLREVVGKQPVLRQGLKDYVVKKVPGNRAKTFLDVLDADTSAAADAQSGANTPLSQA